MIFNEPIFAKHKKTGNEYLIVGLTINCTNKNDGDVMVLYDKHIKNQTLGTYTRSLKEFSRKFEHPDISDYVSMIESLIK